MLSVPDGESGQSCRILELEGTPAWCRAAEVRGRAASDVLRGVGQPGA